MRKRWVQALVACPAAGPAASLLTGGPEFDCSADKHLGFCQGRFDHAGHRVNKDRSSGRSLHPTSCR
jgi:hypothetical protein